MFSALWELSEGNEKANMQEIVVEKSVLLGRHMQWVRHTWGRVCCLMGKICVSKV